MNKKNLKQFIQCLPRTIILVGAHFSGIDMIGKLLAFEKQVEFVPESPKLGFPEIIDLLSDPIKTIEGEDGAKMNVYNEAVVAMPQFTHLAHSVHQTIGAVIFISRNTHEVVADQKKYKWDGEQQQKLNYKLFFPQSNLNLPIAQLKRDVFVKYQMPARPLTFVMDYEWFVHHPMFRAI